MKLSYETPELTVRQCTFEDILTKSITEPGTSGGGLGGDLDVGDDIW